MAEIVVTDEAVEKGLVAWAQVPHGFQPAGYVVAMRAALEAAAPLLQVQAGGNGGLRAALEDLTEEWAASEPTEALYDALRDLLAVHSVEPIRVHPPTREQVARAIEDAAFDEWAAADAVLALLSPEETKCGCESGEDGPTPCDLHRGTAIPQPAASAYGETVALDVLLRLSENSTDGRLRDAIATVRSALHDHVDALSTSGEVKP